MGADNPMNTMQDRREELLPGTHVEVLTKQQVDGKNACCTVLGAAPNTPDTYVVEYHPGLDNGHHNGNELRVLTEPCSRAA
jgi:hypothetical protein